MAGSLALTGRAVQELVSTAVLQVSTQLVRQIGTLDADPGPRAVPRDLRLWLAGLRLLAGVPFGHLVADSALLPAESIRFFYVDRGWTDALVEGALSVGTVTTADRSALSALYGTVRDEVDEAERLVRLPGVEAGAAVPVGPAGTISGFLLRSRLVSGWPGLHVRGYAVDNLTLDPPVEDEAVGDGDEVALHKLGLLRMERLAPAVLLVLFDGVPSVVHLEEPRSGIQFGVDQLDAGGHVQAKVFLRDPTTGTRLDPPVGVDVPFRAGAPGVLHLGALSRRLIAQDAALGPMDAAKFAMQMLQFPFRAVFGDRTLSGGEASLPGALFTPTIGVAQLVARFTPAGAVSAVPAKKPAKKAAAQKAASAKKAAAKKASPASEVVQ